MHAGVPRSRQVDTIVVAVVRASASLVEAGNAKMRTAFAAMTKQQASA
jgi:hypothetical protein